MSAERGDFVDELILTSGRTPVPGCQYCGGTGKRIKSHGTYPCICLYVKDPVMAQLATDVLAESARKVRDDLLQFEEG
jgi:hypothetical protein